MGWSPLLVFPHFSAVTTYRLLEILMKKEEEGLAIEKFSPIQGIPDVLPRRDETTSTD